MVGNKHSLAMYVIRDRETGLFYRRLINRDRVKAIPTARYGALKTAKIYGEAAHAQSAINFHGLNADILEARLIISGITMPPGDSAQDDSANDEDAEFDALF